MQTHESESSSALERRTEAIDLLLENRSESIKANVLKYLVKYKIDPEDEFFIIFTALGELEFFLEKSPQEIQNLFSGFNEEISQWSNANMETLKHLSEKSTITEKLAIKSESLANSSQEFLKVCETLIVQLQDLNRFQTSSLSQLQTSESLLQSLMGKIEKRISQLNQNISEMSLNMEDWTNPMDSVNKSIIKIESQISQLNKQVTSRETTWTWRWKWTTGDKISIGVILSIFLLFGFGSYRLFTSTQETNLKVQWLLEKANRQECFSGVKDSDSPECRF